MTGEGEGIRLQKFLAQAGVSSRRGAEDLIRAGRVRIDGRRVTELGTRVRPGEQRVEVDGSPVEPAAERWILLNKPAGCLTSRTDPQGRPTVYDLLPPHLHALRYVGRLDLDTEGLLLFTTDGDAIQRLTHPRFGVEREYLAWVEEEPSGEAYRALREGVELEDGPARVREIRLESGSGRGAILALVLQEGRKREVRRLLEAVGHPVKRLRRIRFGPLRLERLKAGAWRDLTPGEIRRLKALGRKRGD